VPSRTSIVVSLAVALVTCPTLVGCGGGGEEVLPPASALGDDTVTIGSFDFAESEVLATLYAEVLEMHGYDVVLDLAVGPRELLLPALEQGLVELVPEYSGTALRFVSRGEVLPEADPEATHAALRRALAANGRVTALAPSAAQDANAIVVTEETAQRYGLETVSDLTEIADELTFGGPPECPSRPLCLLGLEREYGLRFGEFLPLDAGGPVTRRALRQGHVDVGLLFSTDPSIASGGFVELIDDRGLQPAENVTPLVHADVLERWGPQIQDVLDDVSRRLSTAELRGLNLRINDGATVEEAADFWLRSEGLR
jgi:osmoprotectant transport system substrate-binding protein